MEPPGDSKKIVPDFSSPHVCQELPGTDRGVGLKVPSVSPAVPLKVISFSVAKSRSHTRSCHLLRRAGAFR